MKKTKLEKAKDIITNLMLSIDVKLAEATKGLSYNSLEVNSEVTIDGEIAKDGTYVTETGESIVVVEGKISEIIPKKEEDADIKLEDEAIVEPVPEDVKSPEIPVEDVLNIEGLTKVLGDTKSGSGSIYFEFKDGELVWGDISTSDYKTLLSKNESTEVELSKLKKELTDKNEMIVTLSESKTDSGLVQAPAPAPKPVKLSAYRAAIELQK